MHLQVNLGNKLALQDRLLFVLFKAQKTKHLKLQIFLLKQRPTYTMCIIK